ncbi:exported hypothetical protein [Vibrio nigripulchritudo SOn1]|uniref:Type 4 secretion system PilS N-terminal domain-containing protein n=1 Tax=Vibrio nigripulchritudo SOn1 TaxID=1238450 RepID=A0AAV2VQ99_9VIBR|nr:hypothetical protein [Vibrio nigripulchritudo]CCO46819.1 exported hypothetical protein [Vibrio nigripulchritudo SOn1]
MKNNYVVKGKKKQSGVAIVQFVLAGLLTALALTAAYSSYQSNQRAQQSDLMMDSLVSFFAKVKVVKRQWGSYVGFSNTSVWGSDEYLPQTMKSAVADQFVTPYSQNGLVFGTANTATDRNGNSTTLTNGFVTATIVDVTSERCVDEVENYVDKVIQVNVGTTRIASKAAMDTACAAITGTTNITLIDS